MWYWTGILIDQAMEIIQVGPGQRRLGLGEYFLPYGPGGTGPT